MKKISSFFKSLMNNKPLFIGSIVGAVALIVAVIAIIVFAVSGNNSKYKPTEKDLSIINEAAVVTHSSQITNKYSQIEILEIDKKTAYLFEFKLQNGETAYFAFAKNLSKTKAVYEKVDGKLQLVLLPLGNDSKDKDNTGDWPDAWK